VYLQVNLGGRGAVMSNELPFSTSAISSAFLPLKVTFMQFLLRSNLHRHGRTEAHSRHILILVEAKVTGSQTW